MSLKELKWNWSCLNKGVKKKKKKNNTSGYCDVQFSECLLTVHSTSIDAAAAVGNLFSNAM